MYVDKSEIAWLLLHSDPSRIKRGLQILCNAIEKIAPAQVRLSPSMKRLVDRHMVSSDVLVRQWLYKLLGLAGDETYVPYLRGQLRGRETDPESITWAGASLFGVLPPSLARRIVLDSGVEYERTICDVAAKYFSTMTPPLTMKALNWSLANGTKLDHLWLCLAFGKNQDAIPKDAVLELNRADDPVTVEYSLWAISRDSAGTIADVSISPFDIPGRPANVRRWYYRVLTKDERYINTYEEVVLWALEKDSNALAREGAALGLAENWPGPVVAKRVAARFFEEEDYLVRLALMRGFVRFQKMNVEYRNVVATEMRKEEIEFPMLMEHARRPGGVFIMPAKKRPAENRDMPQYSFPGVDSSEDVYIYVLVLDTVEFSKKTDGEQFVIFTDLLGVLGQSDTIRRVSFDSMFCMLTGDGLILVIRDVVNRHVPIIAGLEVLEIFARLRSYEVSLGVNSGPARWITMTDGSRQVIAHSVNWAVRVMTVANLNELVISDNYYKENVRSQTDRFPDTSFEARVGVAKHDEEIIHYRVKRESTKKAREADLKITPTEG